MAMADRLLHVADLGVTFGGAPPLVPAVEGLSFHLDAGEVLGIVGETGCGKTATARTIIGLNRTGAFCQVRGRVHFKGQDLLSLGEGPMRAVRGADIGMIFQDPLSSLNPLMRIGTQISEVLGEHTDLSPAGRRARVVELLRLVGIPQAEDRAAAYPHQFSGGMRQRAMMALAIACHPALLIADEPTTALDVTTQMQILRLLRQLKDSRGMAVLLITHDLGVIAELADRVMVMYAGQCVESGDVADVLRAPRHPYTAGLLASTPSMDRPRLPRMPAIPGAPPSFASGRPAGCAFRPRCVRASDACREPPALRLVDTDPDHVVRCVHAMAVGAEAMQ
jgi:peptide/nickel transport system ATP-binding protein